MNNVRQGRDANPDRGTGIETPFIPDSTLLGSQTAVQLNWLV